MTTDNSPIRCFMDGTDFLCELGAAADGNKLFPSVKALKSQCHHSLKECGIAEVEVRLVRWVRRPDHWTREEEAARRNVGMEP